MNTHFYTIKALTNLHVGSGDANYGVIDNLVQRDVVTELPTINGSSLKGALKEFFENKWEKESSKLKDVFGHSKQSADYRFLPASLIAIPVRSNKEPYFLATAPMVISALLEQLALFGVKNDYQDLEKLKTYEPVEGFPIVFSSIEDLLLEDYSAINKNDLDVTELPILGSINKLAYFNDCDFKKLCGETGLPVIARNNLGDNNNLWYEQVVPRESIFGFVVFTESDTHIADFNKELDDAIVHIGANATIGQGFTKITKHETKN